MICSVFTLQGKFGLAL